MLDGNPANFNRLKNAVHERAKERLEIRKEFVDWSLNDIRDFQADLESICKSSVSEKWFYTHLKNDHDKLPRIDVLNLLSSYCGYKNWDDFVFSHQKTTTIKEGRRAVLYGFVATAMLFLGWQFWPTKNSVKVVFIDAYTQDTIPMTKLDTWFIDGPLRAKMPGYTVRLNGDTLVVDGAYYKRRYVDLRDGEDKVITLFPDDYALMLNYFSRSTTEDWQRRRLQLLEAIHPEAKIFQSHPQYEGIELLNRDEFIDLLILPVNSLQNLEIQDIVYKDEKIYRLRFIQQIQEANE